MRRWRSIVFRAFLASAALFCVLAPYSCTRAQNAAGVTHFRLTREVLLPSVSRLGVNLGEQNFYDSGQMARNLIFRNPGFEGLAYRTIFHCSSGGAGLCVDRRGIQFPAGFWKGAGYEVLDGSSVGRRGAALEANAAGDGFLIRLDGAPALQAGDWISLYKGFYGEPAAGWWPKTNRGGELAPERADLSPATRGRQALRMTATAPGSSAQISSFFDTSSDLRFVRLNGRYRLSFRAKPLAGRMLHLHVARLAAGQPRAFSLELPLAQGWRDYSEEFEVHEAAALPPAPVEVAFSVLGSSVLLDDVSLERVDGDPANRTAYRDEVLETLRQLHPGVLRMMGSYEELGSTVANLLAPVGARVRSGYRTWYTPTEEIPVGIPEFLELCRAVDAEPWIALPAAMSTDEARLLAEFFSGPVSTPGGALRLAAGRAEPWTRAFRTIHLELGNETWNTIFLGESIEDPAAYGRRANRIFSALRAAAGSSAAQFDLAVGTNVADPARNRALLAATPAATTLAIAPYLMYALDRWSTDDDLYGPLLAQSEQMARAGNLRATQLSAAGRRLSVYEVNLHTTRGAAPASVLDRFTPTEAAGVAVAGHMLRMMRDFGARTQMLFALPQYRFKREDGVQVRLWGSVVEMGAEGRKRPQFLAESLANRALHGDLVRVALSGDDPVREQAAGNDGVHLRTAHELDAYGLRDGHSAALILFNYGLRQSCRVVIDAPNAASATLSRLDAPGPSATNEAAPQVRIVTESLRKREVVLPPSSMAVVEWTE